MTSLKDQVAHSADALKSAWTDLQTSTHSALPTTCYERWIKRAALHQVLGSTTEIFPARDVAWEAVQAVVHSASAAPDPSRNKVKYTTLEMDYAVARHLALLSYVTVTWSVYDRLANICGRIAGVAELAENPKQNPKVFEDFLSKKDVLGFSCHFHIHQAYAWPLKVTYKIRNWLVHEGYEEGNIPMFAGNRIADEFRLHEDAATYLQTWCGYNSNSGKIDFCCLTAADECWPSRNLLIILERYHAEVDTMFAALVKWSVSSFTDQISAFAGRS